MHHVKRSSHFRSLSRQRWSLAAALTLVFGVSGFSAYGATQKEVAQYVADHFGGGSLNGKSILMTPNALDSTYFVRYRDPLPRDLRLPYSLTWLVVIDDAPGENRIHPLRWLLVNDDLLAHTQPVWTSRAPTVLAQLQDQPSVDVRCVDLGAMGSAGCPDEKNGAVLPAAAPRAVAAEDKDCLYAVLISGGYDDDNNFPRYKSNLGRMYRILRDCGYPKNNIFVYYAARTCVGGADAGDACRANTDCAAPGTCNLTNTLDLGNEDGDNDDTTGTNEVTDGVNETLISARISNLCTILNPTRDVLFIYTSNHGVDDKGLALWNWDNSAEVPIMPAMNEIYSPTELGNDTANCQVCRLFMILDQCYSGEFLGIADDDAHDNSAIYVAATDAKCSHDTEYLDAWDDHNPSTTTMNGMHPAALPNSTPGSNEGTNGNGDVSLCVCWEPPIPTVSEWGLVLMTLLMMTSMTLVLMRRRAAA